MPASGLSAGSSKDPGRGEDVEASLRHSMLWDNMSKISYHQTAFNKEGKSIARRDYLRQAESNSIWRCADSTVWSLKNILAPLHCYFFSDCLRCDICFLSTSSIVFSCLATLPSHFLNPTKSPFFWQPHLVLFCAPSCIRFSHLHLCSAGWRHHSPSPWTGKLAFKHVTKFRVYVLRKFLLSIRRGWCLAKILENHCSQPNCNDLGRDREATAASQEKT